mgnify:CR=1 FL=1
MFIQFGKVLITIDLEKRKTLSFDSKNLPRLNRNNYGILETIFEGKKIEDTRKVICVCQSHRGNSSRELVPEVPQFERNWISLENFRNKDNTGVVRIW